ncbi:MAG: hypothetical protein IPM36_00240 [Lewinellaceae bacterium]|nr:hypothetical protein [Lewinellaceae bacterium]
MDNAKRIQQIFQYIHPEIDGPGSIENEVFDEVYKFVDQNAGKNLAEQVYQLTLDETDLKKSGELLGILIWTTEDNGAELTKTMRKWLYGNNSRKIGLALHLTDIYLDQLESFDKRLNQIATEYPEWEEQCKYWKSSIAREKQRLVENQTHTLFHSIVVAIKKWF